MSKREKTKSNLNSNKKNNSVQFQIEEKEPTKAILLIPEINKKYRKTQYTLDQRISEARGLALAIDLDVRAVIDISIDKIQPSTFLGSGKVEELEQIISLKKAELVIFDENLSPVQQRNLERQWQVKILDRTNLILEIFGRRASTKEGRLQVELAHLNYQKSRLVRSWTHLERQRGGKGFMGGPGETQIESDRRQLQARILRLTKDLEKVRKTRELHRKKRRKIPYPVITLIGYTNAGKSTLFNTLTGAKVEAKDQLFATLDPTMRAITLPSGNKVILSDTVGFISNLPTQLVEAFKATLEEVLEADLILHVQDVSNKDHIQQRDDVLKIIKELGVNETVDIYNILNKVDQISDHSDLNKQILQRDKNTFMVSAKTKEGIDDLLEALDEKFAEQELNLTIKLESDQGHLASWLYENGRVIKTHTSENGATEYHLALPKHLAGKLEKRLKKKETTDSNQ